MSSTSTATKRGLAAFIAPKQDHKANPYRGIEVKDGRDQSMNVSAKIAGYRKREIDMLIASKGGQERGWRTESDFIRFALRIALDFVADERKSGEDKVFVTEHNVNSHIDEVAQQKMRVMEFVKSFDSLHQVVTQLTAQGLLGEAKQAVYEAYQRVKLLEPGEVKDHYYQELKNRFSALMSRERVDLRPSRSVKELFEDPYEHAKKPRG
jgi:hypothetical protein